MWVLFMWFDRERLYSRMSYSRLNYNRHKHNSVCNLEKYEVHRKADVGYPNEK